MTSTTGIIQGVGEGSIRAIARALSRVENGSSDSTDILDKLFARQQGFTIGVTGPPGAGKSTLVNRMITRYRADGNSVGVIAVDPSSPFTGGALLGDRIRMQSHASDPKVFIRSMGSRGHLGGLSGATRDASCVLSAAGYSPVIIETVGVGQAEVEIADLADITLLVLVPGLGDDVQSMKAGIMEIADIIVLNKADRNGIEQLESYVKASLEFISAGFKKPEVVRISAVNGEGLEDLWGAIDRLAATHPGENRISRSAVRTLNEILRENGMLFSEKLLELEYNGRETAEELILAGQLTPYAVGKKLLERAERMFEHNGSN
ncbi:MAG: methylmalonyl Co-A mutase-associated GTPase MeaB [Candidatus Sabulitectum sp.]|nr:methylmalonyl Co-A mutase-associated GTPase MeaB [Candidatus Sabulitectum sp.]